MIGTEKLTFAAARAVADLFRPDSAVGIADERPLELLKLKDACDITCPYYRYLYVLAHNFAPISVVEIGTYVGTSAAHLAHGYGRGNLVTTIDVNPDAGAHADALGYANIFAVTGDSTLVGVRLVADCTRGRFGQVDMLFIDGNHTFNQAWGEYVMYRELVRDGGLILVDDANLEMDGDEMNVFWECVPEPKARVDWLHATGFGIIEKVDAMEVPSWKQAIGTAAPMIRSRRRS